MAVIGAARNPTTACRSGLQMPSGPSDQSRSVLRLMASSITSMVIERTNCGSCFQLRGLGVPLRYLLTAPIV